MSSDRIESRLKEERRFAPSHEFSARALVKSHADYAELYRELGGYAYDQDPLRPGWAPVLPNDRWADPKDDRTPALSTK